MPVMDMQMQQNAAPGARHCARKFGAMFQVHRKVRSANLFRMQMELVAALRAAISNEMPYFIPAATAARGRQRSKLGATFCRNINKGVVAHDTSGATLMCEKYE